jgi:hypothetical protein
MGTTNKGLPYPEPTDPIAAGADAIKNLALVINQPVSGRVTITGTGVATASTAVTFPAGHFTAAPRVTASPSANAGYIAYTAPPTATAVTLLITRADGANFSASTSVTWIAVA